MSKQYYGAQTKQALSNFPFPYNKASLDLIYAVVEIKKAAALAHKQIHEMDGEIADAIVAACDEILSGNHDEQFVTVAIQGGAGTSINMNVNEVIANRASEILGKPIHPNDHVNKSQSTNDVNPSALKIVSIRLAKILLESLDHLTDTLEKRAEEYRNTLKLARTHMQDALPTTLGAEFDSYATILKRDKARLENCIIDFFYDLNLGGTAIGSRENASDEYVKKVYEYLQMVTKLPVKKTENLMSLTSSQADFHQLSSLLVTLCLDMSKMATDLRFMASGPKGGIGEIRLEALQPGSSIMPGKVNPVIPESVNQIYYAVSGRNLTIEHAAEGAHLELGIMFPVIADSLITSLQLVTAVIIAFAEKCIATLQADVERCKEHLEKSTAYSTLLSTKIGYDRASQVVKEAIATQDTIRNVTIKRKLLTEEEFDSLIKVE